MKQTDVALRRSLRAGATSVTQKSRAFLRPLIAVCVFVCVAFCLFLAVGCSTRHNTWLSRGYQRYTSEFNVFFNGNKAFEEGLQKTRDGYRNDYSRVLLVYEFSDAQTARSANGDMETALKKAHKLIELHSITVKPRKKSNPTERDKRMMAKEEYNAKVPEAYLLIGKANVVMHTEQEAFDVFDYLLRKHPNEHATFEGLIWKSIAMCQIGQTAQAQSALEAYDIQGLAPADLFVDYEVARANLYLCEQKYDLAPQHLRNAIKETRDRHLRRRLKYILAQILRETGQKEEAAAIFTQLSKNMSDFDMAFAAKMDLATVATSPEELAKAQKLLDKMLRDPNYEDKLDQIYYAKGNAAMAKVASGDADISLPISLYNKSIEMSVSNDNQKGLSFWALHGIYIGMPKYLEAGVAADSAVAYLDDRTSVKPTAQKQANILHPLTEQLRSIDKSDSILGLATLPPGERAARLKQMAQAHNDALEARRQAAEVADEMSQSDFYRTTGGAQTGGASNWYFYNQNMVSAGKSTFRGKWGKRQNEDNWRRSNKQQQSGDMPDGGQSEGQQEGDVTQAVQNTADGLPQDQEWTAEQILATLPITQEAQKPLEQEREEALYQSALILYDDIADYPAAIAQLERLNKLYPNSAHDYDAQALTYFAGDKAANATAKNRAAQQILNKYPDSPMAQRIRDGAGTKPADEVEYNRVYSAYLARDYQDVIKSTETLGSRDTRLRPKALLVRAMAYGKTGDRTQMRANLEDITANYAGTPQDSLATLLLAYLNQGRSPLHETEYTSPLETARDQINTDETDDPSKRYTAMPDSLHAIVCIVNKDMGNRAQFVIADYNFSNFLVDDYDLRLASLPDGRLLVLISPFANAEKAMQYYYALREQSFWKEITAESVPKIYAVAKGNLKAMITYNLEEAFEEFWRKNYLERGSR